MDINVHLDRTEKDITQDHFVVGVDDLSFRKLQTPEGSRAEVRAKIEFFDDSVLHFFEQVETGRCYPQVIKYAFVYERNNQQVFRYDNKPDHNELSTHPHHKHVGNGETETIEPAIYPNHSNLLEEIHQIIRANLYSART